jgi:putative ABC transport system ATP-binding protein
MRQPRLTLLASDVRKSYGTGARRQPILRGVSLEVSAGETLYLTGPSGSGKTTLLSILGCILTPDEGSVQVLGEEVARMSARQRAAFRQRHLGFVFQSFNLFPLLSALDNIRLVLSMQDVGLRAATAQAEELFEQVGLADRGRVRAALLSGGECQRVAIARSLASRPALLFVDEPTASLDADNGRAAMTLLTHLVRERDVTLVVVTHDERIFPFADRIVRLEDGRLTDVWKPASPHHEVPTRKEGCVSWDGNGIS